MFCYCDPQLEKDTNYIYMLNLLYLLIKHIITFQGMCVVCRLKIVGLMHLFYICLMMVCLGSWGIRGEEFYAR